MPDEFVPPIATGAVPLRTQTFFNRVADQARRSSLNQTRTSRGDVIGERIVCVRINNAAAGGGKYEGFFQRLGATITSLSTDLVDTDFGAEGDSCVIYNLAESQQTTHALTATGNVNQIFLGVIRGAYTDGRPIVWINGVALKDDCG